MKIRRFVASLLMFCTLSAFALTDQQVIDYIKQQTAAGKSEQQIGKELLAKGVTPEQAQRIKAQIEGGEISEGKVTDPSARGANVADEERRHDVTNYLPWDNML